RIVKDQTNLPGDSRGLAFSRPLCRWECRGAGPFTRANCSIGRSPRQSQAAGGKIRKTKVLASFLAQDGKVVQLERNTLALFFDYEAPGTFPLSAPFGADEPNFLVRVWTDTAAMTAVDPLRIPASRRAIDVNSPT